MAWNRAKSDADGSGEGMSANGRPMCSAIPAFAFIDCESIGS